MKGLPLVLLFTAMTFIAWGAYGPVLHHGTSALKDDALRAFVGVGLAYFLIAVIIPVGILSKNKEAGKWTASGTLYSLIAGAVGALGALGVILALGYGGKGSAVYVMPLVFGFAPVVNTLVSAFISKTFGQIRPIFIAGIVTAALGAVGVLTFRSKSAPTPAKTPVTPAVYVLQEPETPTSQDTPATAAAAPSTATAEPPAGEPATEPEPPTSESKIEPESQAGKSDSSAAAPADDTQAMPEAATAALPSETHDSASIETISKPERNNVGVFLSIVLAAFCWGSYGPMLHIGQGKMAGSRLRPFVCVGVAYFLIAVLVPLFLIQSRGADTGSWTGAGMTWSFFAGVAGAVGALGVILAFNAGGKPYYVMPLIFGFAPVINTFISLSEQGKWNDVQPLFWVSLAVVIAGAVTVLITAPKPKPKPAT